MTTKWRAQVRIQRDGVTPEDDVVNVWHFDADDPDGEANDLADRVITFYQTIGTLYSSLINGNAQIKLYDMEDPEPRVPIYEDEFTITNGSGDPLPAEMSACLSFRGALVPGLTTAGTPLMGRRKGRVYIGPLKLGTGATSGPDFRLGVEARELLITALQEMAVGPDPGDARLAVYSPTTDATGTLDDAFTDVVYAWVDNAYDVQRRRGAKPTAQSTGVIG